MRNDARTDVRSYFVLVCINHRIESGTIDEPLFDKKRFERLHTQGQVRRNCLMLVVVIMILVLQRLSSTAGLWSCGEPPGSSMIAM